MKFLRQIRDLELRVAELERSRIPIKIDEPLASEIDTSPKAPELDIFSAKVSLAGYELRDIIEAVSVAGERFSKNGIISKLRHAFDAVNQHRLERGLGGTSEPDIDEAIKRTVTERVDGVIVSGPAWPHRLS